MEEKNRGKKKKKIKKRLTLSKDKVKHHAGVLLGVFPPNMPSPLEDACCLEVCVGG